MSKFADAARRGSSASPFSLCSAATGAIVAVTILTAYSALTSSSSRQRVACVPTESTSTGTSAAARAAQEQENRIAAQYVSLTTVLIGLKGQAKGGAEPALVIKQLNTSALRIPPTTVVSCDNCDCDLCGLLGLNVYGLFSPVESAVYGEILRGKCGGGDDRKLVIDVGGNIGYFTVIAAALGCRVKSFEPQALPRSMMQATLALNHFGDRTEVFHYAIGEAAGAGQVVRDPLAWGRSGVTQTVKAEAGGGGAAAAAGGAGGAEAVEFRTLSSLVAEEALLLKVDTEGYELAIMEGSYSYLRNYTVANAIIEVKEVNSKPKRDMLARVMAEAGFTFAYNFGEDYYHSYFHNRGARLSQSLYDVTEVITKKKYDTQLCCEEFWLTRERLVLANM